jgi:hypothetical protein
MHHIFIAPPYDKKSGGVYSFYKLFAKIYELREFNLLLYVDNQNFKSLFSDFPIIERYYIDRLESKENEINSDNLNIVFPETIEGLPFRTKYGTEWRGNAAGTLPTRSLGTKLPQKVFSFVHSSCISVNHPRLFVNNVNFDIFNSLKSRSGKYFLIYVGKSFFSNSSQSSKLKQIFDNIQEDYVIMDREWPKDKSLTANLIYNCKGLISLDPLTALVFETMSCDKPALILVDEQDYWTEELLLRFDVTTEGMFVNDWQGFIEATKAKLHLYEEIKNKSDELENFDFNAFVDYLRLLSSEDSKILDTMKSYKSLLSFKFNRLSESIANLESVKSPFIK